MAPSCLSGLLQVCCVKASQLLISANCALLGDLGSPALPVSALPLCHFFPPGKGKAEPLPGLPGLRQGPLRSTLPMFGTCPELCQGILERISLVQFGIVFEYFSGIAVLLCSFDLWVGSLSHPLTAR